MSAHKRQHSGASDRAHKKKPHFKDLDEAVAVMLLHNDKLEADERERENFGHGIFSLPAEWSSLQVTSMNGQARLANSTHPEPLALLSVCRLIRKEAAEVPFQKATFKIVTFRYVSMLDTWQNAIGGDPDAFLNFLESIPAPYIQRFNIVGVMGGSDGLERMVTSRIQHYCDSVDHKTELESLIREIYPLAEIIFRDVADIGQL